MKAPVLRADGQRPPEGNVCQHHPTNLSPCQTASFAAASKHSTVVQDMRRLREEVKTKIAVTLAELRNMQQLEDALEQAEVRAKLLWPVEGTFTIGHADQSVKRFVLV